MIYYDDFESWGSSFDKLVEPLIGQNNLSELISSQFEYIENAGDFISDLVGVEGISSAILEWLNQNEFCVFHGTRLLPKELQSIESVGLKPLVAFDRLERLTEVFSSHSDWDIVKDDLVDVINDVELRDRENQVHFSLSRSGLVNDFSHYLAHGSEFDQHVASRLFDDDTGLQLLQKMTAAYLVCVRMSGEDLVRGVHPILSYQDVVYKGEVPGVGATFLNAWAYKRSNPDFDIAQLRTDCCVMQKHPTSRAKILKIEALDEMCPN